jgi:hypothetical protein
MNVLRVAAVWVAGLLPVCGFERPVPPAPYEPREGDIFFQAFPHNALTDAIEGVTQSPRSHCGILHKHPEGWVIIEAVEPVRETPLADWIRRGREGKFEVFRLKAPYREKIPAMIAAARSYLGRPYDLRYRMDDEKIYCSELVYKAFRDAGGGELGRLQKLGEMNWKPHEAFIRQLEGGELPLEREMITPRAVSEAPQLEKVHPPR